MKLLNKYFIIILLLTIINILLYVFISYNKPINKQLDKPINKTIPDSNLGKEYILNMYYATWCSWSQKALPDFKKLKQEIDNNNNVINNNTLHINLYDIDNPIPNDEKLNKDMKKTIKQLQIKSYPTILLFNGYTRKIQQYDGDRTYASYIEFLKNLDK